MDCHLFSRRQPSSMVTGTTQGGSNLLSLAFGYGTSNNNGNVLSQTITMPKQTSGTLTLTQAYGYDGVNRLASAGETVTAGGSGGGAWSFTHGYDQFGNMWVSSTTGLAAHSATPRAVDQFGATTNRLTKAFDGSTLSNPYDAAGNLINHPYVGAMQYDAENRQKQFTSGSTTATYHYDGDGRRVKRVLGGQTTVYVYDAFGMLAAEYSTAAPTETGGRRYRTTDHLGSTRLVTDDSGAVKTRHDYVPFGEELPASSAAGNRNLVFGFGVSPSERHKFTGKERDAESNLDYFIARYYSSPMGRFTSADEPLFDQQAGDPKSWNLYAYGRNNPLRYLDPTGRKCVDTSNGLADDETGGGCAAAGVDANGNIQSQQVNVTAQQGSLLGAVGIGALIGISNAASDYFAWMFSSRPATLQNIDLGNNRAVTTAAMIAPFLIPGPKGGQATKLLNAGTARPILTQEALEHIVVRHWATSGATGVGKFSPGTTARALRGLIEETVEGGVSRANTRGRAGNIVEYDFGRQIGTDVSGQAASRLRVVLNPDNSVRTAFPVR